MKHVSLAIWICAALASASSLTAQSSQGCKGFRITGAWDLRISPDGAPAGAGFVRVQVLSKDGTSMTQGGPEAPPPPVQAALGDSHGQGLGVWDQTDRNQFQLVEYSPVLKNGIVNGFKRVRTTLTLSETGQQYTSTDQVDWLDLRGNVVFSGSSRSTATRLDSPAGCQQ